MSGICDIRPTGKLHIGHYFSVIKPHQEHHCDVLIANLHVPWGASDNLARDSYNLRAELIRFGVNELSIRHQSFREPLFFYYLALAQSGDLMRMTQFKSAKPRERTAHLYIYPVLMACDIASYEKVYVGEDQRQHLEFAANLIGKGNSFQTEEDAKKFLPDIDREKYKVARTVPEAVIVGGRVMDLKDPSRKMSKSRPKSCLFLNDSPEDKKRKIMGAATTPEGIKNLNFLYREFLGSDFPSDKCEEGKRNLYEAISKRFPYQPYDDRDELGIDR